MTTYFDDCRSLKQLKEKRNEILTALNSEFNAKQKSLSQGEIPGKRMDIYRVSSVVVPEYRTSAFRIGRATEPLTVEITSEGMILI